MIPISVKNIEKYVKGSIINKRDKKNDIDDMLITNVSTDTRLITEGSLFIPIVGERFDAHDFIDVAFDNGAVICLIDREVDYKENRIYIMVDDTTKALGDLAKGYLQQFNIPIIAVTGSVGKTSTKDMIASVLSTKYNVLKTDGNYNNNIGLPLTVFRLNSEHQVAILEMGMNHFDEIRYLSNIARQDISVITNIGVSHIENLGSREGILEAKCEIFEYMNKDGLGIINVDDDMLCTIKENYDFNMIAYGKESENDCKIINIENNGNYGTKALIKTKNNEYNIDIRVVGQHMVYNTMPAIIIAEKLGLNKSQILKGIQNFIPTKMRLNVYKLNNGITILDDVYNASPDSMKAALDTLEGLGCKNNRIAILGDMLELGEYAEIEHSNVGEYASNKKIDKIVCVGSDARFIYQAASKNKSKEVLYYTSVDELNEDIDKFVDVDDVILVKASRGMKLERIIERLKR